MNQRFTPVFSQIDFPVHLTVPRLPELTPELLICSDPENGTFTIPAYA